MSYITSFEILENEINKIPGQPTVLEALWDGDTQGWFLLLSLYTETRKLFSKEVKSQHLGIVRFGGDIRLFTGEVPSWPEAVLAKEWGQKAEEKYGLTFYFPSDNEPDDDCPNWTQRHLAIKCADCGKSIIPSDSPYLPKGICFPCHLLREQNERIKLDEFYKDGVYGTYQAKDNSATVKDFSIYSYLQELVNPDDARNEINIITFSNERLLTFKNKIYQDIKQNLINYKKSDLQGERRKFGHFEFVNFEGKEYELECQFNEIHRKLSSLIYRLKTLEKAELEGWTYYLHLIKGITNRDDAFLRFINFIGKGSANSRDIQERYKGVLSEEQIFVTLRKLERLSCIEIENDVLKITDRGKGIILI